MGTWKRSLAALLVGLALVASPVYAQDMTTILSKFFTDVRGGFVGIAQKFTTITVTDTAIATTPTDGIAVVNTTPGTSTQDQYSPRIRLCGSGWNSTSAASETHCWVIEQEDAVTAGTTVGGLRFGFSRNSAAYAYPLSTFGNGTFRITTTGNLSWSGRARMSAANNGLLNILESTSTLGTQINTTAVAPTFNNGTITAGSRNMGGQVTLTGGNTGGTVSFGSPNWSNAPFCIVTGSAATDTPNITAASVSAFTVAGITANGVFTYNCIGRV